MILVVHTYAGLSELFELGRGDLLRAQTLDSQVITVIAYEKSSEKQAHQTVDSLQTTTIENIENYRFLSRVEPSYLQARLPAAAPQEPETLETILNDYCSISLARCSAPRFNSVGFNWLASPAATELETIVMDWLAKLLNLPRSFMFCGTGGGVIQGTTSEAILCTLVAARDRALEKVGQENIAKLVIYGSDQTHSTYTKVGRIAGFLPSNIRCIPTFADTEFSLDSERVIQAMEADIAAGLVPVYLCATVGTTSSTAVDPVWCVAFHVDATYAGSACICRSLGSTWIGIEGARLGQHQPTQVAHELTWTVVACGSRTRNKPSESNSVVDYKDWQVVCGRRFRALPLWLVLRSHGVVNLQAHIRSILQMAKAFEAHVSGDPRFEIVVPRRFSSVCFRLNPPGIALTRLTQPGEFTLPILLWVEPTYEICGGGPRLLKRATWMQREVKSKRKLMLLLGRLESNFSDLFDD
ncbi:Pyridoxal phosphate-dependent decarboxylase [Cinnamomum micranthum f. kanehirae]|uniref:Pyridoxal phosphate-dependent decarboxylase n=1 Tax=Cinnamomum micranthum f. kanehirae TaxID=337451 RepID=A0A443PDG6_9MAGN|nr:Pyridoxal phosphate-dependent decarboxylase [Cinnamomum micranthum f. kanehirae]